MKFRSRHTERDTYEWVFRQNGLVCDEDSEANKAKD